MDEPFMSPILGIVRVKFLSGRRTGDVVCSLSPCFLTSVRLSLRSLAALHFKNWSTFRGQTDADGTSATAADDTLLTRLPQEWHILRKELF